MNSSKVTCPKCQYDLNDLVSSMQNKMAGLIQENSQLKTDLNRFVKQESDFKVKLKQRDKTISDLKKKIDDLVKSTESAFTSQQGKGEAQELVLEELLQQSFPSDDILEVKKGARGADCIQVVKSPAGTEIGRIIYESKNTKTFSEEWKVKLKEDNLEAKATILIIVTSAMPKDYNGKFMIQDGIWICRMEDVTELVLCLRYGMIKLDTFAVAQSNKETNQAKLFDYLTSELFRNRFEHILESFRRLQESHNQERLKMALLWKDREKSMSSILTQSIEFYSDIKGNAGVAFPELQTLQMLSQAD